MCVWWNCVGAEQAFVMIHLNMAHDYVRSPFATAPHLITTLTARYCLHRIHIWVSWTRVFKPCMYCTLCLLCLCMLIYSIVVLYAITRALQLNNSLIIQMMPSSCKIPPEQSWSLALRWWRLPWGHSLRMQQMTWRKHWRTWSLGSSRTHAARWRVCHRTSTTPQLPCCPSSLLCLSTSLSISSEWTFCVSKALYMLSSIMEKLNALSWRTYGLLLLYHYCFFFLNTSLVTCMSLMVPCLWLTSFCLFLVDDVQVSCYRILSSLYSLGTGKNIYVER